MELQAKRPSIEIDGIARFLRSPEADMAVRSVALAVMSGEFDRNKRELKTLFSALLNLIGGLSSESADDCAVILLNLVEQTFQNALKQLYQADPEVYGHVTDKAAIERSSGYQFRAAARNARFSQFKQADLLEVRRFIGLYRPALSSRTAELVPAYFDVQRRVSIDPHYVPPRFNGMDQPGSLSFSQMLAASYRTVVLGDPGAGKSTLVQKLAYDFARPDSATVGDHIVPFIVSMRSYEEAKRTRNSSLIQFLAANVNENFHIETTPDTIEYIFLSGRGLVLFDGLDELLEISRRREMVAAVESFSDLYTSATVVVTSRVVGYDEAPVNPGRFHVLRLMNFTDDDVATYVTNWFAIDDKLAPSEQAKVAQSFLAESESVTDLRRNALMLGLLCNVYRGIRAIPQNRADLYEKCAEMLFEKWDAHRGILTLGPLKADAKSALQDVALWAYTSPQYSQGIPRPALERRLAEFWKRRYESDHKASEVAADLLDQWRGRTWVLTDFGTSVSKREELYKFTHQTFLEYFAACELVRRNPSPSKLWRKLLPHVRHGSWDIVAQLAIQKLNEGYGDAGDTTVQLLIREIARADIVTQTNLLSFAARNLDALYVQPRTSRALARACVQLFLQGIPSLSEMPAYESYAEEVLLDFIERQDLSVGDDDDHDDDPEITDGRLFGPEHVCEPLLHMMAFTGEQSTVIVDEVSNYTLSLIGSDDEVEAARSFVLLSSPQALTRLSMGYSAAKSATNSLLPILVGNWNSRALQNIALSQVRAWAYVSFWAPIGAVRNAVITPLEALEILFEIMPVPSVLDCLICTSDPFPQFFGGKRQPARSLAETILRQYLEPSCQADDKFKGAAQCLNMIGLAVAEHRKVSFDSNWSSRSDLERVIVHSTFLNESDTSDRQIGDAVPFVQFEDPYAIFGGAILVGYFMESEEWKLADYSRDQVATLMLGSMQPLEPVFVGYVESPFAADAVAAISQSNLPDVAQVILSQWIDRKIKFAY